MAERDYATEIFNNSLDGTFDLMNAALALYGYDVHLAVVGLLNAGIMMAYTSQKADDTSKDVESALNKSFPQINKIMCESWQDMIAEHPEHVEALRAARQA